MRSVVIVRLPLESGLIGQRPAITPPTGCGRVAARPMAHIGVYPRIAESPRVGERITSADGTAPRYNRGGELTKGGSASVTSAECAIATGPAGDDNEMRMRTVFIDADACPVTGDAIAISRRHHVPVVVVANSTQNLARLAERPGVEALQVGVGSDAADFAIVERLEAADVVITQDLGLAAMVLGRGAAAISPRGRVHSSATIDMELAVRHAEQRLRRAGGRTRGPSAMDEEDRDRFRRAFERLLTEPTGRQD